MNNAGSLFRRDETELHAGPPDSSLLLTLFVLILLSLSLIGTLYFLRRRLLRNQALLPVQHRNSNPRRLTISATSASGRTDSIFIINEKRNLMDNSSSPPPSPIPEIRITFPDEEATPGKRQSTRVVVLRIGDSGAIGMEPVAEEHLPPYQSSDAEKFHSLDLERMGGLREKREEQRRS